MVVMSDMSSMLFCKNNRTIVHIKCARNGSRFKFSFMPCMEQRIKRHACFFFHFYSQHVFQEWYRPFDVLRTLFVDELVKRALVLKGTVGEPLLQTVNIDEFYQRTSATYQSNLLLGVLDGVRSVADVLSDVNGVVTTDGSRSGCEGVSLKFGKSQSWYREIGKQIADRKTYSTKHHASNADDVLAFPNHTDNRARKHVVDELHVRGLLDIRAKVRIEEIRVP